jgi:cytoskeletal protein CcmA (bactofilin family)
MALFGKDDRPQRLDDAPAIEPSLPSRAATDAARSGGMAQAHLGAGSRIEGKLAFEGSVQIDGHVTGEIDAKDTVVVGDKAVINAQIIAGTVIVKGKVTGDVVARKRLELQAPARLVGNITTPSLVIHEGVVFEGNCSMGAGADAKTDKGVFPKDERTGNGQRPQPEARK